MVQSVNGSRAVARVFTSGQPRSGIPMKLARLSVAAYLAFIVGSLFCVPWEGWVYGSYAGVPQLKTWHVETRTGSVFTPPPGLLGANPSDGNYLAAKNTPPRMRPERLLVLWTAAGLIVAGIAWSATAGRQRPPEPAASPSRVPLAQSR